MDCALDTSPFPSARTGGRIIGASEFDYIAIGILDYLIALDDVGVFETDLSIRLETEELLRGILHEVGPADVEFTGERNASLGSLRLCRVERAVEPLHLARLPVGEGDLDRVLNHHVAVRAGIEVLADAPLEKLDIHQLVALGDSYFLAEHLERLRSVAPSSHAAERRHPRVIPAAYKPLLDKFQKLALTHQCICEVQSGKFVLM